MTTKTAAKSSKTSTSSKTRAGMKTNAKAKAADEMPDEITEDPSSKIEMLRVGDLLIDTRIQRDKILESTLNEIRQKYNREALRTFEVSRRDDGGLYLIDGQHRRKVVMEKDPEGADYMVKCVVHTGLTLEKEAELFVQLNKQRTANALDLHKARVTQGDEIALALDKIVDSHGWKIGTGAARRISAVKVLESLYYAGEDAFKEYEDYKHGPVLVDDTIGVITAAWGTDDPKAVSQNVLKAVGEFLLDIEVWVTKNRKDESFFDYDLLASAMHTEFKAGPGGWVGEQRGFARASGKSMREALRISLWELYNKKQRSKSRKLHDDLRKPRRQVRPSGLEPDTSPV